MENFNQKNNSDVKKLVVSIFLLMGEILGCILETAGVLVFPVVFGVSGVFSAIPATIICLATIMLGLVIVVPCFKIDEYLNSKK